MFPSDASKAYPWAVGMSFAWALSCAQKPSHTSVSRSAPASSAALSPPNVVRPAPAWASKLTGATFTYWEYRYDRNALVASVALGTSLIGLTEAGNLVEFAPTSFAFSRELVAERRATALGTLSGGDLGVGFEGGRVAKLRRATFELETVGEVPGVPLWIGVAPNGDTVVVDARRDADVVDFQRAGLHDYAVHWLGSGRATPVKEANVFLADSLGRLWLGADHGEWGGTLEVVDLTDGARRELPDAGNVYGLFEVRPGEVWATGGLLHMGSIATSITRVSPELSPHRLFEDHQFFLPSEKAERWRARPQPHAPVTHVMPLRTGRFLVFAYAEVFEADPALEHFELVARLNLRSAPGRPDAVGTYPALRAVHLVPSGIALATSLDGYLTLNGSTLTRHALEYQVEADVLEASASPHRGSDVGSFLDGQATHRAVDATGRTWLAGNGLFYLDDTLHAVAVHRSLPFFADTVARDLAIVGDSVVVALGARGIVRLPLSGLVPGR